MRLTAALSIIGLLLAAIFLVDWTPARYEVFELPVVPGYTVCSPDWITNGGDIWGWCSNPMEEGEVPETTDLLVRWNADLKPVVVPFEGQISSVNDHNQAAGFILNESGDYLANIVDDSEVRRIELPGLQRTKGCAINNNGLLVVHGLAVSATGFTSEFLVGWDSNLEVERFRLSLKTLWFTLRANDKDEVSGILGFREGLGGAPFVYSPTDELRILEFNHTEMIDLWVNNSGTLLLAPAGENDPFLEEAGKRTIIRSLGNDPLDPMVTTLNNENQVVGLSYTKAPSLLFGIEFTGQDDWWARIVKWYYSGDPHVMETRAILWEKGKTRDLNNLIRKDSGWFLTEAYDINDNGDIVGVGFNPKGEGRSFVLRPIDRSAG